MAVSLYDHERRIDDLEMAVEALARALQASGDSQNFALQDAIRKLMVSGGRGGAGLLTGTRMIAPYRR